MKIGFVGLGKLGLPVALAIADAGHEVFGYDTNREYITNIFWNQKLPYVEEGADALLQKKDLLHTFHWGHPLHTVVEESEIIFVAVQTPHHPDYEGVTPLNHKTADFDYSYLIDAIKQVNSVIGELKIERTVVIISTVLPGTIEREILRLPELNTRYINLVYNPFFIAMGTVIPDFRNPEFVLVGARNKLVSLQLVEFYQTIHNKPVWSTSILNAELTKVAYNTFISMKLAYVNMLMEVCHKTGCDVDEVTMALKLATDRLISPKYLDAGMGDGGGCHPRDNIAMSWLAEKLDLSHDLCRDFMEARQEQTYWLAGMVHDMAYNRKMDIIILGKAFKANTNIVTGSPALLFANLLKTLIESNAEFEQALFHFDPLVDINESEDGKELPFIYFIATKHDIFKEFPFGKGSIVIDPWRYLNIKNPDIEYIPIGRPK